MRPSDSHARTSRSEPRSVCDWVTGCGPWNISQWLTSIGAERARSIRTDGLEAKRRGNLKTFRRTPFQYEHRQPPREYHAHKIPGMPDPDQLCGISPGKMR